MTIDTSLIATISGAIIVPVTALLLNYRGFTSIENRFASLENRLTAIENRLDRRLDGIGQDLKEFYRVQAAQEREIDRLKEGGKT